MSVIPGPRKNACFMYNRERRVLGNKLAISDSISIILLQELTSLVSNKLSKSVQIWIHPIKLGQASSTGTAMPLLMKQIAMS